MELTEIRERLDQSNIREVSKATGISRMCLYNIVNQKNKGCNLATLEKLQNYFQEQGQCVNQYQK